MKKDIAFRHTYLNFGQRPFDLKIRGTSVSLNDGAQFGGGVLWRLGEARETRETGKLVSTWKVESRKPREEEI